MKGEDYTEKVSELLGWGLNTLEISVILNIHRESVKRIKLKLKKWFWEKSNLHKIRGKD